MDFQGLEADFRGLSPSNSLVFQCFFRSRAILSVLDALRKVWEVPKLPLGAQELWHFGPNGPPMNVMDACPVSKMLWVGNQPLGVLLEAMRKALKGRSRQDLFGFSLTGLEAQVQTQSLRALALRIPIHLILALYSTWDPYTYHRLRISLSMFKHADVDDAFKA